MAELPVNLGLVGGRLSKSVVETTDLESRPL